MDQLVRTASAIGASALLTVAVLIVTSLAVKALG
jgi:hypothetical protein